MILDSSAIIALLLAEPGYAVLERKLADEPAAGVGAPTLAKTAIVLSARMKRDARGLLARFTQEASVAIIPFSEAHYGAALDAWLRFGKGRHPAALNFGDCMAYAVAKLAMRPLLCTGDDFRKTDLDLA